MTDTTCLTTDYCGDTDVVSGLDGDVIPVLEDDTDLDLDDDLHVIVPSRRAVNCVHSRPCSVCTYLIISVLLVGSVVALAVVGVMVIAPYRRVEHYRSTDCLVSNISRASGHRQCSCGKSCSSVYPCLTITVTLPDVLHNTAVNKTIIMHEDETLLDKSCSYYPRCRNSKLANELAVIQYRQHFGVIGVRYPCLYNPTYEANVIRIRKFRRTFVINTIVWPLVTIIVCVSLLVIAHKRKRSSSPL